MAKRRVEADPDETQEVDPVVPVKGQHIMIEGAEGRNHAVLEAPAGWDNDYRLLLNGRNYEHVSNDPDTDVWVYRRM